MILDRAAVIDDIEPDPSKQRWLWWSGDSPHFFSEANHAFNHLLISQFEPNPPKRSLGRSVWRSLWRSR